MISKIKITAFICCYSFPKLQSFLTDLIDFEIENITYISVVKMLEWSMLCLCFKCKLLNY